MDKRLRMLETFYRWYDDIAWSLHPPRQPWACRPGCASCCTSTVILTSLEAAYLWEKSSALLEERMQGWSEDNALPPLGMTTNEHASLCLSQEDFEEDAPPSSSLPCPLLSDEKCICYEARPLMCRLMFSSVRCEETSAAEMPPRLLSLNTASLQFVENLDEGGQSGYLRHLLPHFQDRAFAEAYRARAAHAEDARLRPNRPNPGFLTPPEDREQVQRWLEDLSRKLRDQ